jgi:hypothetical protein
VVPAPGGVVVELGVVELGDVGVVLGVDVGKLTFESGNPVPPG